MPETRRYGVICWDHNGWFISEDGNEHPMDESCYDMLVGESVEFRLDEDGFVQQEAWEYRYR